MDEKELRTLTEADVEALAMSLEKRLLGRFYSNLGKGFWHFILKGLMYLALLIAAYGAGKGMK